MTSNSSNQLEAAVREFQAILTPAQNLELLAHSSKPDTISIITFMKEIDIVNERRKCPGISSRLSNVLQSIQGFSTIADTFVSSNPKIAALVWGTVKFAILVRVSFCWLLNFANPLKAVNNVTSFFDKLWDCFSRLHKYCPRYSEYKLLFGDSTRLQKALCDFYATIISFCMRAFQKIQTPGTTLTNAIWRPFETEFGDFENTLQKQNDDVKKEIKLAGEQAAAREREAAAKHRSSELRFRTESKQISKEAQETRLRKDQQRMRVEREKLLEKLSSHDYIGALNRIRKKRHGRTSSWLSKNKAFEDWLKDNKSRILWLSGILGSGKSVVTAAGIDDLLRRSRKGNDHIGFFFCEYDNASSLTARTILGTLVRQCLSADTLSKTVEGTLKDLFEGTSPDAEDLEPLLHAAVATSSTTIFAIDGFDECGKDDRIAVLKMLHRLMSSSQSIIKIFLSSREEIIGDIGRVFDLCQQVAMDCEEARADISAYVDDMIEEKLEDGELEIGDIHLKQDIQDVLVRGANGMFLWVAFQIEDLCRQKCDADIRKCLTTLPKDLPETYRRVLSRIIKEGNAEIVNRIFRWIAAAKRPLLSGEIQEAIAIEPGDPFLRRDRFANNTNRIIQWCGSLVTLDEKDHLIQFAHHTVKQFILSEHYDARTEMFHFQLPEVNRMAGEICVTYLNFNDFQRQMVLLPRAHQPIQPKDLVVKAVAPGQNRVAKYGMKFVGTVVKRPRVNFNVTQQLHHISGKESVSSLEQLQMQYSFLAYAREFWLSHTAGFTQENTRMWAPWKELVLTEHPLAEKPWTTENEVNRKRPIMQYILNESHCALIACSWSDDWWSIDISELLVKVSGRGIAQVVECILGLEKPAAFAINESLQVAAGGGHMEVVERLLTVKADVNAAAAAAFQGRTALQAAAGADHMEVVERLLAAKADVNAAAANSYGRTALQAAAEGGHMEVVERLLTAKADVNAVAACHGGRTALQAAAQGGHMEVIERLLAAKADVNAIAASHDGKTALQTAAQGGHMEVVERLLVAKADVNAAAANSYGRTALQAAAGGGHMEVVERLLAAKADVNAAAANSHGQTALQAAAEGGHMKVVERLLTAKADVNAVAANHGGRTALQAAAEGGHMEVVERLLTAKTDVNALAARHGGRTALQAAAKGGHMAVVERLLTAQTDVNAVAARHGGRTALQAAAEGGYMEVVERLLTAKADVNALVARHGGRTALQVAAQAGHMEVVKMLLGAKADVNARASRGGRTALQVAAQGGHVEVVKMLLEAKADVDAGASHGGRTALQAAAGGGHMEMVKMLLGAKADVNASASHSSQTALQAAAQGGHMKVVKLLKQKGALEN